MLADEVWDAAGVERAPYRIVAGRRRRPRRRDRPSSRARSARCGPGDARDGFNGGGNFVRWVRDDRDRAAGAGVLPAPLRPGAGDAVPRRRAVLDPRVRAARRHGGAPAGRDRRSCATRARARSRTAAWATSGTRPTADREAMRGAVRRVGEHLQRDARLPRRVRHRRRAHRRRVPADRAQHPDVGRRHRGRARSTAAVLHLPAGRARARRGPGLTARRRRGAACRRWTPTASARSSRSPKDAVVGDVTATRSRGTARAFGSRRRAGDRQPVRRWPTRPSGLFAKVRPLRGAGPGPPARAGQRSRCYGLLDATYGVDLGDLSRPPTCADRHRRWPPGAGGGRGRRVRRPRRRGPAGQARPRRSRCSSGWARSAARCRTVAADGFEWDAGPTSTLLPAVVRDLFRKSGRPVERELELEPLDLVREHWFEDGTSVRPAGRLAGRPAPGVRRAGARPRPARGSTTSTSFADDWEVLRRAYFETPWDPADLPARVAERLRQPGDAAQAGPQGFKDERLRQMAAHPFVAEGHEPAQRARPGPAWSAYLEQRFGAWTITGGMAGAHRRPWRRGWRPAG